MMRVMMSLLLLFMMMLPVPSRSFTIQENPVKRQFSFLLQSPEVKHKINPEALNLAIQGYYNLKRQGAIRRDGIITLIDFQKSSVNERLYVVDINRGKILYSGLVAHGKGSGDNVARDFSNIPGSNKSSLGFYLTDNTYMGKHGYSLVLKGMDRGINDNAQMRSIVMHGADYVSYDFISKHGRLGRSLGCPALSFESYEQVIDLIKGGTCLFIFNGGRDYASRSDVLNPDVALQKNLSDSPA
jgi:hypothetical protein